MTNGRLQHIKELVRLAACDPHLDQTKLNDILPLTIDGVLGQNRPKFRILFAKKDSSLKEKGTLSPVVRVVTNISYV